MVRPIQRISAEEAKLVFKDYVANQIPVIIQDLYPDEDLLDIQSEDDMAREFGHVELRIGQNYYDKFLADQSKFPGIKDYIIRLDKYFSLIKKIPETDLLCREQRLPPEMAGRFTPSSLMNVVANPDPIQKLYVANHRTVAPLHFDGDLREVLFTQILGKKEIFLIEPKYSARLFPNKNFCGIPVHNFDEQEKEAFFAFHQAYHCVLEPRETLYMPKLWWHQLTNIGITAATSVRFGTSAHARRLKMLPLNYLVQNIARDLLDPISGIPADPLISDRLMKANFSYYPSQRDYTEGLIEALQKIYKQVCVSAVQVPYHSGWVEKEVKGNFRSYEAMHGIFDFDKIQSLGDGDLDRKISSAALGLLESAIQDKKLLHEDVRRICSLLDLPDQLSDLTLLQASILFHFTKKIRIQQDEFPQDAPLK